MESSVYVYVLNYTKYSATFFWGADLNSPLDLLTHILVESGALVAGPKQSIHWMQQ